MASTTIKTVAGNTAPPVTLTLEREGTVIDLTNTVVTLTIKNLSTQEITVQDAACSVTDATGGVITYTRGTGDIPTEGSYVADVKITYTDSTFEILYNQQKFKARAPIS
jgi:hypothetical protein